ncbi:MAG TPA: class I SAM-dependent methyltransferase, partial [Phycisphaerae bacterium]|nr:class I SAM-dependent methyltransferase [Phycisphaerae bacterium]
LMGDIPQDTVHVDVPAGTGRFFFYLRDRGRTHRMIGLDISTGMLEACRRISAARGDGIAVARADAFRLPLPDASVDLLTSLRMFHLFPNATWPDMLREWHRVLRPGGVLITELRNQFRATMGLLLSPYFRKRRRVHPHTFVAAGDVKPLFADWTELTMQGVGLDGLHAVSRMAPPVGRALHALETHTPLRYLSKTLLIRARKPA